jgi:hypothetical protein
MSFGAGLGENVSASMGSTRHLPSLLPALRDATRRADLRALRGADLRALRGGVCAGHSRAPIVTVRARFGGDSALIRRGGAGLWRRSWGPLFGAGGLVVNDSAGTKSRFARDVSTGQLHGEVQRLADRSKLKSESVMAGFYLGIAVTSLNALVAMGLVLAFTGAGLF